MRTTCPAQRSCAASKNASMPLMSQRRSNSVFGSLSCRFIPAILHRHRMWNSSSLRTERRYMTQDSHPYNNVDSTTVGATPHTHTHVVTVRCHARAVINVVRGKKVIWNPQTRQFANTTTTIHLYSITAYTSRLTPRIRRTVYRHFSAYPFLLFTARCYASAVLAMAQSVSAGPSVCLSVRHRSEFCYNG